MEVNPHQPLNAAALTTPQPAPLNDSSAGVDEEMLNLPQQPNEAEDVPMEVNPHQPLDAAALTTPQPAPSNDPSAGVDEDMVNLPQQSTEVEDVPVEVNPHQPLDAAALTTPQPAPLNDSSAGVDEEIGNIPQQPPPTSPNRTTAKDGHDAGSSNLQVNFKDLISIDCVPDYPPEQSSNSHNTTDAPKAHTSGLSEPDVESLLELIQKDEGFGEGSKPQRDKIAEAIMAVRDASQSQEWSNLLRGAIILTICLGFPKGDVSVTRTRLCI